MSTFIEILKNFKPLQVRYNYSLKQTKSIEDEFKNESYLKSKNITIFIAGSIGRMESGKSSDLDLFFISNNKIKRLDEIKIYSTILNINEKLNFPDFSNDGQFLKIHYLRNIIDGIGSPRDDYMNLFTTRMLLILESKPLYNKRLFKKALEDIIASYFRDCRGKKDFKPLFLLNDLLRFWRTLCLNYEQTRHDPNRPWRKKNINLKFSRMLTVFGTILPLIAKPIKKKTDFYELCQKTPMERIAFGLDFIKDNNELKIQFNDFLQDYEDFLLAKEKYNIEVNTDTKHILDKNAVNFSDFLFDSLCNKSLRIDFRKYLIL